MQNFYLFDSFIPKHDNDSGSLDTLNYIKCIKNIGFNVILGYSELLETEQKKKYTELLEFLGCDSFNIAGAKDFSLMLEKMKQERPYFIMIFRPELCGIVKICKKFFPDAVIIYNMVDYHFLRLYREFQLSQNPDALRISYRVKQQEEEAVFCSDVVVAISETDSKEFARNFPRKPLFCIGIGREQPVTEISPFIRSNKFIFLGGFSHTPNLDAAEHLISDLWPAFCETNKSGILEIVGSNMPSSWNSLSTSSLIFSGHVADLREVFSNTVASLAPLRFGAGQKGKVVTSLSFGVPVIGYPLAFEGMFHAGSEKCLILANSPEKFVQQMDSIIRANDDARIQHCVAARDFFQTNFSIDELSKKIKSLIDFCSINFPIKS